VYYRRRIVALAMLFLLAGIRFSPSQTRPELSNDKVVVTIATEQARISPGQDVRLCIEIRNEGPHGIFIFNDVDVIPSNALATVDFTLYKGKHAFKPTFRIIADSFGAIRSEPPALIDELTRNWIGLPPRHFYGGEIVIPASSFAQLSERGKYRIQGKYKARGFLAQDINNPLLAYSSDLKKLPYQAWAGEVETNSVWIVVGEKDEPTKRRVPRSKQDTEHMSRE
jgi:hypothetical protein